MAEDISISCLECGVVFTTPRSAGSHRRAYCATCQIIRARRRKDEYKARHRERCLAAAREYQRLKREDPAYRERQREATRLYREKNHEKALAATRSWVKRFPEKAETHRTLRRARLRGAPIVERVNRGTVYDRDRGRCHICKRAVSRKNFHIDHLVPLSKGGDHTYANVALSHPRCNLRRGPGRIDAQLLLLVGA